MRSPQKEGGRELAVELRSGVPQTKKGGIGRRAGGLDRGQEKNWREMDPRKERQRQKGRMQNDTLRQRKEKTCA